MSKGTRLAVLALAALGSPHALAAQSLRDQCAAASRTEVRTFCENVADAVAIVQPRLGIALAGGNPVPGTASTLGMRIGAIPRISLALRVTAAELDLPPVERITDDDDVRLAVGSIDADVSVGLFQGFSLVPTVAGFGSVDLLGSIGTIPLPRGEGFDDASPLTWAAGARVGILRESFTAPGLSLSVMYRAFGDVAYGSETLSDRDAFFRVEDYHMTSIRGVIGKRLLGFGLTGGIAWDRYSADVAARVRDPAVLDPTRVLLIAEDDIETSRIAYFANASLTFLIVSIVAEAGWQQGGDGITGATPLLEKGALFGGIAIRLGI